MGAGGLYENRPSGPTLSWALPNGEFRVPHPAPPSLLWLTSNASAVSGPRDAEGGFRGYKKKI